MLKQFKKWATLLVALFILIGSIIPSSSLIKETRADTYQWVACVTEEGKIIYNSTNTDMIPFAIRSKSSLYSAGIDKVSDNLYNKIMQFGGFSFGERVTAFNTFGFAGLNISSYAGEWKYNKVDACSEKQGEGGKTTDYGQFYEGRYEPQSAFTEVATSLDIRSNQFYKGMNFAINQSIRDNFVNFFLGIVKLISSFTIMIVGVSFGDVPQLVGIKGLSEGLFNNLYYGIYQPLLIFSVIATGVYMMWKGLVKKEVRLAFSSLLKMILVFVFAIALSMNPKWLSIPGQVANLGQAIIVNSILPGEAENDDICSVDLGVQKSTDINTANLENIDMFLQEAGRRTRNAIGCRIWSEFAFRPWARIQWGKEYEDLKDIGNKNSDWVKEPIVPMSNGEIKNWGLFQVSTQTDQHIPVDGVARPKINGLDADWWRIVDANSNIQFEVLFEGTLDGTLGSVDVESSGGTGNISAKKKEQAQIIYAVFKEYGLSDVAISGLLGNWEVESQLDSATIEGIYNEPYNINGARHQNAMSNWDSFTKNVLFPQYNMANISRETYCSTPWGCVPGIGLAQWTGNGAINLIKTAELVGKNWWDPDFQIAYVLAKGAPTGFSNFFSRYNASVSTPEEAAVYFRTHFEGTGGVYAHDSKRINAAAKWARESFTPNPELGKQAKALAEKIKGSPVVLAEGIASDGNFTGFGSMSGKVVEIKSPVEPTDTWNHWVGNTNNRTTTAILSILIAVVASIPMLILAFVNATYAIGLELLMSVAPLFLLMGMWAGRGQAIFTGWVTNVFSTIIKKIVTGFLLVFTINLMADLLKMTAQFGYIKSIILMGVFAFIIIRQKDNILKKFSQINLGGEQMDLSTPMKTATTKVSSKTAKAGKVVAGTAAISIATRIKAKRRGEKFFGEEAKQKSNQAVAKYLSNKAYSSDNQALRATIIHDSEKHKMRANHENTYTCLTCGRPIKQDEQFYRNQNGETICQECGDSGYGGDDIYLETSTGRTLCEFCGNEMLEEDNKLGNVTNIEDRTINSILMGHKVCIKCRENLRGLSKEDLGKVNPHNHEGLQALAQRRKENARKQARENMTEEERIEEEKMYKAEQERIKEQVKENQKRLKEEKKIKNKKKKNFSQLNTRLLREQRLQVTNSQEYAKYIQNKLKLMTAGLDPIEIAFDDIKDSTKISKIIEAEMNKRQEQTSKVEEENNSENTEQDS